MWKTRYLDHIIQQTQDNYNCGIYACYFFNFLLSQKFFELKNDFHIDNYKLTPSILHQFYIP